MYKRAISAFVASYPLFLMIAALLMIADELMSSSSGLGSRIFITSIVAFFSHRVVLTGEKYGWVESLAWRDKNGDQLRYLPFIGRFLLLFLTFILFTAVIMWGLWTMAPEAGIAGLFLMSVLIAVLPYGVLLALIGTILPASAINEDASLSRAFRRGKGRFWKTLWQLIYGNLFFAIVFFIAYYMVIKQLLEFGLYDGVIYYVMSFAAFMGSLLTTLLAATALSIAYEETRDCP